MRILLAANASYVPPRGGSTRSNLAWLESLADAEHECQVVAADLAKDSPGSAARIENELREQQIRVSVVEQHVQEGLTILERDGVRFYCVANPQRMRDVLRERILTFQPDWVLVSSEDLGQVLLREAKQAVPDRVIYLAHTPQMFPFGPASMNPSAQGTSLVAACAAVVTIGNHTARYVEQWVCVKPAVIHPPVYGPGPFANYGERNNGLILTINPCAVKGLSIFFALARLFPGQPFGALPGWGTTEDVRATLSTIPNVTILKKVRDIDEALQKTRILLIPSLWHEGFGLVVTEALLRGIPVLASDQGGLVEAKLGTRFVLPVRPIERYQAVFDEQRMPIPVVPEQELGPWVEALHLLLSDPAVYARESVASRTAALEFVSSLHPGRFAEFLVSLKPASEARQVAPAYPSDTSPKLDEALARLSPERRALLLRRLRNRS